MIPCAAAASSVTPAGRSILFDRAGPPAPPEPACAALLAMPWVPAARRLAVPGAALLACWLALRSRRGLPLSSRDLAFLAALALSCLPLPVVLGSSGPVSNAVSAVPLATLLVALLFDRRLALAERATWRVRNLGLLEWADPAQPVLGRLAREAPGTWVHSLVVVDSCEAACNGVGANGMLGLAGGYYHDVGQLAEAGLTGTDLDQIEQVFVALLAAFHLGRLEYPRSAGGVTKESGRRPA